MSFKFAAVSQAPAAPPINHNNPPGVSPQLQLPLQGGRYYLTVDGRTLISRTKSTHAAVLELIEPLTGHKVGEVWSITGMDVNYPVKIVLVREVTSNNPHMANIPIVGSPSHLGYDMARVHGNKPEALCDCGAAKAGTTHYSWCAVSNFKTDTVP